MITVKNLHKYFGKIEVLTGIDEHISKGEVVVVIGPSGSGKSTFLRCLNLLETPTDGEIYVEWKRTENGIALKVESKGGTTAVYNAETIRNSERTFLIR